MMNNISIEQKTNVELEFVECYKYFDNNRSTENIQNNERKLDIEIKVTRKRLCSMRTSSSHPYIFVSTINSVCRFCQVCYIELASADLKLHEAQLGHVADFNMS